MKSSFRLPRGLVLVTFTGSVATAAAIVACAPNFTAAPGGDFLDTGLTQSFFSVFQVDPRSEDSAGPQFVRAGDLDGDGLTDLVSAWNQSQPIQLHLQRRSGGTISFETLTLAGSIPAVSVSGLAVADFDRDGRMDIAVLVKESLVAGAACLDSEQPATGLSGLIMLYMGPADGADATNALAWEEVPIGASFLQGAGEASGLPEEGGFTAMTVGDMDGDFDQDIVVAWNSACGEGTSDAVVFTNNGPGAVRDGTWTGTRIPDSVPQGGVIKDVAIADIDNDGDMDIVATFPDAATMNVRWYRNPILVNPDDPFNTSDGGWQVGLIAQIATGADTVAIRDIDGDGMNDVVVRSTKGRLLQWLKGPAAATTAPLRSIPWQVFTIAEFTSRAPAAMALEDVDSNGRLDVIVAAGGALAWFDSGTSATVFDQWRENVIVDEGSSAAAISTDPNVTSNELGGDTFINTIVVVDLDGDGRRDLVVTLDRNGLSGLSNDALAWFRNTRR